MGAWIRRALCEKTVGSRIEDRGSRPHTMENSMRRSILAFALTTVPVALGAQAGKFPPDSLVNVKVIPKGTSPIQVVGQMRNFAVGLGVRCVFCHVGEDGPLDKIDFVSDQK